jgi:alkylation response protein AidB-like acyl-CoA dehydrogenase
VTTGLEEPRIAGSATDLTEYFAARARDVDTGDADLHRGIHYLAELGLVGHADLARQAEALTAVAKGCMASAFALWAQVMTIRYLDRAPSPELREQAALLRRGDLAGSTAMAGAFQDVDGFRRLDMAYRRDGDDLVLDGVVRWASNLRDDGFVVVLGARATDGTGVIVAVPSGAAGLEAAPALDLLALGGTASSSLRFDGVRVPPAWVVSTAVEPFVATVRPAFLLLQTALCLGLAGAALDAADDRLDAAFAGYRTDHDRLRDDLAALHAQHHHLLHHPTPVRDLVQIRLDGALLAQAAVALETRVVGGAGYLASSPTARRLREAAFLPIQSPTEGHLRWQLATSAS